MPTNHIPGRLQLCSASPGTGSPSLIYTSLLQLEQIIVIIIVAASVQIEILL